MCAHTTLCTNQIPATSISSVHTERESAVTKHNSSQSEPIFNIQLSGGGFVMIFHSKQSYWTYSHKKKKKKNARYGWLGQNVF